MITNDITDKMKEISLLTQRFIKAKDVQEKWHIMELCYANGYTSIAKYMFNSIEFQVANLQPEEQGWLDAKRAEANLSDFSGPVLGDDR